MLSEIVVILSFLGILLIGTHIQLIKLGRERLKIVEEMRSEYVGVRYGDK